MKKLFIIISVCLVAIWVKADGTFETDFDKNPGGGFYSMCVADVDHNTGRCKSLTESGKGSACVKPGFLQSKNCFGTILK